MVVVARVVLSARAEDKQRGVVAGHTYRRLQRVHCNVGLAEQAVKRRVDLP